MTAHAKKRHRKAAPVFNHVVHSATQAYVKGVDVYHGDGRVDWNKVKSSGIDFAFAKATDGKSFIDHRFSTNWAGIKAAGLVRGAYHFARPEHPAVAQAQRFFKVVNPTHGDLPLVLDLEKTGNLKPAALWQWTQDFLAEIQSLTGQPAIIYVGGYFWKEHVGDPKDNLNCPLWLADYSNWSHVPLAWTDWTFLQYTDKGKVTGIDSKVDSNYFLGTLPELQQLTLP